MSAGQANIFPGMGTWNNELKRLRQIAGLKQDELASEIAVDQTTISSIEVGRREPSTDVLLRWVRRCGGRVEVIMPGDASLTDVPPERMQSVLKVVRGFLKADPRTQQAILLILQGGVEA